MSGRRAGSMKAGMGGAIQSRLRSSPGGSCSPSALSAALSGIRKPPFRLFLGLVKYCDLPAPSWKVNIYALHLSFYMTL